MAAVDAETLHRRLVEELVAAGTLAEDWRAAFEAVPRHAFIPNLTWHDGTAKGRWGLIPRRRADDPDGWLSAAYQDDSVITQVDDGEPSGPDGSGVLSTSSASMPTVVAVMLRALKRAGYHGLTIVTADGTQGFPPRAPYDRMLSTASCQQVPYPWVAQTVPGGTVLTPWCNAYYPGGLLSLTVAADGTAAGRIVDRTWFMQLRDQRLARCSVAGVVRGDYHGEESTTTIGPYELAGHRGAMLAIGQRVPRCHHKYFPYDPDEGAGELWFLDPSSGSWASHVHVTPDCGDDEFSVRQRGPRRLWDEVRAAHTWWTKQGRLDEQDWVFTVTATQQNIALI